MAEPAPLLSVRDLGVTFTAGEKQFDVVRGVSFDLAAGETLGLVGESGSGKSVTALSILQLLPYPTARHKSGSIRFAGTELVGARPQTLLGIRGNRIAMIFQEPMSSLNPVLTIEEQIVEVLAVHRRLDRKAAAARALELLEIVRIPDPRRRLKSYPFELSGGQAQRAMIAMALANEPQLLIADEPTTALDVTIQAQVLGLIAELQQSFGMALLLITHDLRIVEKMAHRVCVMNKGEIVEHGPVKSVFSAPQHAYTRMLLAAQPKGGPVPVEPDAPVILEARDVRVVFPIRSGLLRRTTGEVRAVDGVSLAIRRGQTLAVVGESGSGKTTLGRSLLRLQGSAGAIRFEGAPIDALSREQMRPLRRRMQIVFQDPFGALSPRVRVGDIVGEGLRIHAIGTPAERDGMVAEALREVGLDPETRRRFPHEFSGGQRQRIAIARVLVLKPALIVLDEPTSALDRSVQAQIVDLLRDLQARHRLAYLFISHDLAVVRALADEVMVMKDGKVLEAGPAASLFAAPVHPYTRALFAAAFDLEAADAGAPRSFHPAPHPAPVLSQTRPLQTKPADPGRPTERM
ncbi:microcin C transport system ATP-binding protein [Devosia enhydra]|uniref:Microcin C transport system ATP-binding protein n=1 Tax=Devosia enhydra TaxID=665118 RepID=A0A1K2HXN1_9HYPH|nr:ABC transporter ATP-binding protein [Devosia enhydra]SFZ84504.1 microcin C transport system ATP-binding protein [Devosia enhydra]